VDDRIAEVDDTGIEESPSAWFATLGISRKIELSIAWFSGLRFVNCYIPPVAIITGPTE
jgi:hypothetical protein